MPLNLDDLEVHSQLTKELGKVEIPDDAMLFRWLPGENARDHVSIVRNDRFYGPDLGAQGRMIR
jgi:hypothetical protein